MHDLRNAASTDLTPETEPVSNRARALALDILSRIRPVCAHMPDEELLELSTRMALVELYYFEQVTPHPSPRRRAANG
ncbi:MAG TPA: hypothetical protein VFY85_15365 [Gemmatimonadaceae bacterium]|nr:hypothetical protein [Gemmatimonadaceae bacterium]